MSHHRRGAIAASAQQAVTPGGGMVLGAAVNRYPDGTDATYAEAYAHHNSDLGVTMGVLRSYSSPGPIPSSWATIGGSHPRQGNWQERWSYHSFKPSPQSVASGAEYQNIINFINTIPVTGYKRLITFWHEMDVQDKIPNDMSFAEAKQMLFEGGRAVRDAKHPDVLYGPCWGSKFSIGKATTIMQSTSVSTAAVQSVCDFSCYDPYNGASHDGDYGADKQGPAGASFYLDPLIAWHQDWFPTSRFGIGEVGYRPNAADLTMRPTYMQAFVDKCAAQNGLVVCYFDTAVVVGKQNYIRRYASPRSDAADETLNWFNDTASIAKWAALYTQYPAWQA